MDNQGYRSYGESFGRVVGVVVSLLIVFLIIFAVANLASNDDNGAEAPQDDAITLDVGEESSEVGSDEVNQPLESDSDNFSESEDEDTSSDSSDVLAANQEALPNTGAELLPMILVGFIAYFTSSKLVFNKQS